jgi:hypothetical protein
MSRKLFVLLIFGLISSCASTSSSTGSSQNTSYGVGPGSAPRELPESAQDADLGFAGYSVIIPPFDPGIKDIDPNEYDDLGIWPELRRTEALRMPYEMKELLEGGNNVAVARIVPDTNVTGHFYLFGEINESNGEDAKISINLVDISGKTHLKKNYNFRAGEYQDPRATSRNLYSPLLQEIAEDVDNRIGKIKEREKVEITGIEAMRFAEAFQPEYFSQYLSTRRGRTTIVGFPAEGDPEYERIKMIKTKDQLYIDNIQKDYSDFVAASNDPYFTWQQQAYIESKAAREARATARGQLLMGVLSAAAGVAMAANADPYSSNVYTGAVIAAAGVAVAIDSAEKFKDAKTHEESLNEMGKSINIELTPKVIEVEDRQVELIGTAEEQFNAWREFLKEIYLLENTPNVEL